MSSPEELALENIDALLKQCCWIPNTPSKTSLSATVKDWSSSDKTSFEGNARRVSAGSANQFQQFVTPDDGRKFTELYNVQHLKSSELDKVRCVCPAHNASGSRCRLGISTIQRLYSMLCSLFFWNRNTDAAWRDQREETGHALCAIHEARSACSALSSSLVSC